MTAQGDGRAVKLWSAEPSRALGGRLALEDETVLSVRLIK